MNKSTVAAIFVILFGWAASANGKLPKSFPLARTVQENRPALAFDPGKPFQLDIGRGGCWSGLDTVSIHADGTVLLSRIGVEMQGNVRVQYGETATLQLSTPALKAIGKAIQDCGLLQMQRAYHAGVTDGTQWIFWLRQENGEKSIYFDNHFPAGALRFSKILDNELDSAGFKNLRWNRMKRSQVVKAEKAFFNIVE